MAVVHDDFVGGDDDGKAFFGILVAPIRIGRACTALTAFGGVLTSGATGSFAKPDLGVILGRGHAAGAEFFPLVLGTMIHDHRDGWAEAFELVDPVRDGTERTDDQERTPNPTLAEVTYKCNGLEGFPQPHFVGKDAVESIFIQRREPMHAS